MTIFEKNKGNKGLMAVIIIIIVIVLLIIGGIYWTIIQKPGPKETFLNYRSEIRNIKKFDEIKPINQKYLSQRIISKTQEHEQIELSEETKSQLITMAKSAPLVSKEIKEIREKIITNTTAKLYVTLETDEVCVVPCVLEDDRWKFEVVECKGAQYKHKLAEEEIKPSCGSILKDHILNVEGNRTDQETKSLSCMKNALLECTPASIQVEWINKVIYKIEGRDGQYCNISKIYNFITTCKVPLSYIKEISERYRTFDGFVQVIIGSIDAEGKQRDMATDKIEILFECE